MSNVQCLGKRMEPAALNYKKLFIFLLLLTKRDPHFIIYHKHKSLSLWAVNYAHGVDYKKSRCHRRCWLLL